MFNSNELPESMYDYRHERDKAKKVRNCKDCNCDLYEGEEVFAIGNYVYCDDCVRKVVLDDE